MQRGKYAIFSKGTIADMELTNRMVRSATWDPSILGTRQMSDEVLTLYRNLAQGGVGMIISGGFPVYREKLPDENSTKPAFNYFDLRVNGLENLPKVVHQARPECKIIAQLEVGYLDAGPSPILNPFSKKPTRVIPHAAIEQIILSFVDAIVDMKAAGFDGVQLHAAHGGTLCRFLSPYSNRRLDEFGGTPTKRSRIIHKIVTKARNRAGAFPILIKMNCTDYLPDGVDFETFPALAREIARTGVDAIEISGGMWDCLSRPVEELDFRPVPSPESHTRINKPEQQSYFLKFAEKLELSIPVILVGGNRNIENLENIVKAGKVDFIALCRPLIREPNLPNRWLEGRGSPLTECVSCNSCIYDMFMHPGRPEPGLVTCICKNEKKIHQKAQKWLTGWRDDQIQV